MRSGLSAPLCALALVASALAAPPSQPIPRQTAPWLTTPITDLAEPWALAFLPDDRVLVTEKAGTLRLVNPATGAKGLVTGVPPVRYGGQGGLGDVALHPDFAHNKLVYISYVEPGEGAVQSTAAVARAKLVLDTNGGGALQCLEVIWRQTPKADTNVLFGHRILFGGGDADPTTLWITSGDRGLGDPAQDLASNLGKLLRLNDDGTAPADNPFASQGGVAAQVWALGFRNSLGVDYHDGRLWAIEQGPSGGDEIDLIVEGGNYGWPLVSEGDEYNGQPIPDHSTRPDIEAPKAVWTPVIAPSSLIIYKGTLFPWTGDALITGLQSQGVVRVELTGNTAQEAQRVPMGRRIRAIKESDDGVLWTLEDGAGGRLLKHTPL